MTKPDIAILSCKIAGIFIVTTSITVLVGNLVFISSIANNLRTIYQAGFNNQHVQISVLELLSNGTSALTQLLLLGLGIWLWIDGRRFSEWIFPDDSSNLPVVISSDFSRVFISLMGIVILMIALPHFFSNWYLYANTTSVSNLFLANMLSAAINTAIGFWLFFGAKDIFSVSYHTTKNT